jgi:actin-related protein
LSKQKTNKGMYCGDETGAYIGDIGSSSCRFGYGGEDNPKLVIPSFMASSQQSGNYIPSSCYRYHQNLKPIFRMPSSHEPILDPNEFLSQGDTIENWDALEEAWNYSFQIMRVRERNKHTTGGGGAFLERQSKFDTPRDRTIRPTVTDERLDHPILAVRSGFTHVMGSDNSIASERRELATYTELLMESLQADSCFIAPSPMLSAFSHGRQTCLIVDVGAGGCRITPVVEGLLLKRSQRRNGRGGDWIGNVTWHAMRNDNISVTPRYCLKFPENNSSLTCPVMMQWAMRDLMSEFRTSDHVSLQTWRYGVYTTPFTTRDNEEMTSKSDNPLSYELPDGTLVNLETTIGHDLKRVPELLFTDDVPFITSTTTNQHSTICNLPLHHMIQDSLSAVGDVDIRKELCGNIVLVGGSSLLPNMEQRLSHEVSGIISAKCKIIASKFSVERSQSAFIGGSVLTSLGSFQQLWLSRKEYDEYGAALAIQRFPN